MFESYDGGRDSKERLMQGLLGAIENAPDRSLIVVFTDNGSKDLNLKNEVLRRKNEKGLTVYIVLTPIFEGFPRDPSLKVYDQVIFSHGPKTEPTFFDSIDCKKHFLLPKQQIATNCPKNIVIPGG